MTCAEVQAGLSLYLYGELDFANEELIEVHLAACAFCQLALDREKQWHAAVNRQQQDVPPEWLAECRSKLSQQVSDEPANAGHVRQTLLGWWHGLFDIRVTERSYRLAGVSFLVLLGFGAGRMVNSFESSNTSKSPLDAAGFLQPPVTEVQEVRPQSGNRVRLLVQQIQVREISGNREDDGIRTLLLGAARGSDDPGVRMDSVEMLAGQSALENRNAILNAVRTDPNAAVRVKAIESLRQFPIDPAAREALEFVLAHDRDSGVRTVAIDALVPSQGDFQITPQLLQTITDVMQSAQSDEYLRWRCAQVLNEQSSSANR